MAINKDTLIKAAAVSPKRAADLFDKLGLELTATREETEKAVQRRLFAITRAANMEMLQDFKNALEKSIREGETFATFKANIENTMAKRGWWGLRKITEDGVTKTVNTGPWRLRTIYRTNVQTAINAGRKNAQQQNTKARPYWELIEVLDDSTRATHASRSGSIAHYTSSFWKAPDSWYPPNGFNCRGRVRALTEEQAKERGIGIKGRGKPDKGFGGNPNVDTFEPKKSDFDPEIWKIGQDMKKPTIK